jgi:hypothetical protein
MTTVGGNGIIAKFSIGGLLLACLLTGQSFADEIVTGQETSPNQMPTMSEFTRSGGTSVGTGGGCSAGEYCTAGKDGP